MDHLLDEADQFLKDNQSENTQRSQRPTPSHRGLNLQFGMAREGNEDVNEVIEMLTEAKKLVESIHSKANKLHYLTYLKEAIDKHKAHLAKQLKRKSNTNQVHILHQDQSLEEADEGDRRCP